MVDYYFWLLVIPSPNASADVTTPLFCFDIIMISLDGWVVSGDYRQADIPSSDGGIYNELE